MNSKEISKSSGSPDKFSMFHDANESIESQLEIHLQFSSWSELFNRTVCVIYISATTGFEMKNLSSAANDSDQILDNGADSQTIDTERETELLEQPKSDANCRGKASL